MRLQKLRYQHALKLHAADVAIVDLHVRQVHVAEGRAAQIDVGKSGIGKIHVGELRLMEVDVREAGAGQISIRDQQRFFGIVDFHGKIFLYDAPKLVCFGVKLIISLQQIQSN